MSCTFVSADRAIQGEESVNTDGNLGRGNVTAPGEADAILVPFKRPFWQAAERVPP